MDANNLISVFSIGGRKIKTKQLLVIPLIVGVVVIIQIILNLSESGAAQIKMARKEVLQSPFVKNLVGDSPSIGFGVNTMFRNDTLYFQPRVSGSKREADILCIIYATGDNTGKVISIEEDNGRFARENTNSKWLIEY